MTPGRSPSSLLFEWDYPVGVCSAFLDAVRNSTAAGEEIIAIGRSAIGEKMLVKLDRSLGDVPRGESVNYKVTRPVDPTCRGNGVGDHKPHSLPLTPTAFHPSGCR